MTRAARYGSRTDAMLLATVLVLALVARALPERHRDPIAAVLRRTVVAPLISLQQSAELTRNAIATHEERTAHRDTLALRAMAVPALERENDRLRLLLGLAGQLRWGFVPAEALHTRGIGEEFTLTLTAGSNAGVRPFAPVIAPEGLVGMVQTVDPTMSTAIIWPHPDFRVSAMAGDGSAFGIVAAHRGGGPERYLLEMRGVQFRSELEPGTLVVSSGLGGVYPRGIPIGTVVAQIHTQEGWARTYLIRPAVFPPDVSSVMILKSERGDAGVSNIWARATPADSVDRRVTAAADSIARAAAQADAAARRAALERARRDSLRADSVARSALQPTARPLSPAPPVVDRPVGTPAGAPPPPERRDTAPPAAMPVRPDTPRVEAPRRDTTRDVTPLRDTAGRREPQQRDSVRRDTSQADTGRQATPASPDTGGTGRP